MRPDLGVVAALVPPGSRVLDLGCGDGTLLEYLAAEQGCWGTGVEIDEAAVLGAIRRGVPVIELDIDRELGEFADGSYDVVVLSQTLQATHRPRAVLQQMARIARRCVVSVPNFGQWRHRVELVTRGRMPVSRELPHQWHETPNIHLSTLLDLEELFTHVGLEVDQRVLIDRKGRARRRAVTPNLTAVAAVYSLTMPTGAPIRR